MVGHLCIQYSILIYGVGLGGFGKIVLVHTSNGTFDEVGIIACDFHHNLLVIAFESSSSIEAAKMRSIDLHESVFEERSFQLRPHSVKVRPNESVIIVGRYFYKPFVYMAASGSFSAKHFPSYECKELLSASCFITRCGDGGPLINQSGEVIGISFYNNCGSPILPINIPCKWWNHYKKYKELRHPFYGFEASTLEYSKDVEILERVKGEFPRISGGVAVETLWKVMFDKVGKSVKLKVARLRLDLDKCSILKLRMVVTEAMPDELNKWPQREKDVI